MLKNYQHQKDLQRERIEGKSCESLFSNIIVQGTNCSHFESEIIVEKAKEVFRVGEWAEGRTLQPGQMVFIAVSCEEPGGKPLDECAKKRIVLTHIDIESDCEVLAQYGARAKRRAQILRMSDQARKQAALLTQEDLSTILGCDARTIRRDIAELKQEGYTVPTRGQQKDIGRGVTHKQQAVRFYLEGMEPLDIARRIKHSLKAVERYIDGFCRVVYCREKEFDVFRTALIIGVSSALVRDYLAIYEQYRRKKEYADRSQEVARKGRLYWENQDFKKKAFADGRAEHMKGKSPNWMEATYGPVKKKTFPAAIMQLLEKEFPQLAGDLTRRALAQKIQSLADTYYPASNHMRPGQMLWIAVDEKETGGYGKSIEKNRNETSCPRLHPPRRHRSTARRRKQTRAAQKDRRTPLHPGKRPGRRAHHSRRLHHLSHVTATISKYIREHERDTGTLVPRRGTIHDMGPSITHKRQICHMVVVEGKSISAAAQESSHSPEAVTRYVRDYKRICTCLKQGLTIQHARYITGMSKKLSEEYLDLFNEFGDDFDVH